MFDKIKAMFMGESDHHTKKILVVDDNQVDRELIYRILKDASYNVRKAMNGQEALDKIKEDKPNLILMDYHMPEMDGIATVKKIKEDESLDDIPVIFLTAFDSPNSVIDCFEVDADNYLAKPISAQALKAHVETALREAQN